MLRVSLPLIAVAGALALAGCAAPVENVACRADAAGVHLTWDAAPNETEDTLYTVFRIDEGMEEDPANWTVVGETNETHLVDENVTEGATYQYFVVYTMGEETISEPSELCVVTAVPEFPTLVVGALALVGGVLGYAALRRRA